MIQVSPQHPEPWTAREFSGPVRFDAPGLPVTRRLEPGDIAVVDVLDLDTATAQELLDRAPRAVLNLRSSLTGRRPVGGARILLDAGVPLVDHVDRGIMSVRDGSLATVKLDTTTTLETPGTGNPKQSAPITGTWEVLGLTDSASEVPAKPVAAPDSDIRDVRIEVDNLELSGQRVSTENITPAKEQADAALLTQASAFAAQTADALERIGPELLGDQRPLALDLRDRDVLVVGTGIDHAEQWASLRSYVRDRRPVIVAVGVAAAMVQQSKAHVDIVVGSLEGLTDAVLNSVGEALLHAPASMGGVDGAQVSRAQSLGLVHAVTDLDMAAEDVAILVAHHSGARSIVTVGIPGSLDHFLDSPRLDAPAAFLVRLVAGDKLVSAPTAASWHKAAVPAGLVAVMVTLAVVALVVAVWLNPDAREWIEGLWSSAPWGGATE